MYLLFYFPFWLQSSGWKGLQFDVEDLHYVCWCVWNCYQKLSYIAEQNLTIIHMKTWRTTFPSYLISVTHSDSIWKENVYLELLYYNVICFYSGTPQWLKTYFYLGLLEVSRCMSINKYIGTFLLWRIVFLQWNTSD